MKEIEVLRRVILRDAIEQKVPQEQLDKIIDEINVSFSILLEYLVSISII
jgi:hypothetical protein